jgi:hypothetical protein
MLSYQRQDLKESREWFTRFQKEFPQSEQAATAAFMLEKIRTLESKHELPPKPAAAAVGKMVRVRIGYLWAGICLFRARSVLELGDSQFTALSIVSILFRLNGELFFVSYALVGT